MISNVFVTLHGSDPVRSLLALFASHTSFRHFFALASVFSDNSHGRASLARLLGAINIISSNITLMTF